MADPTAYKEYLKEAEKHAKNFKQVRPLCSHDFFGCPRIRDVISWFDSYAYDVDNADSYVEAHL